MQSPNQSSYKIIHRRILCLMYQWITSVPVNLRPEVYNILVTFLDNPDLAIRLTAALSLDICTVPLANHPNCLDVSDMEFNPEDFNPFLNTTIERLFRLVSMVETGESKLKLLTVMNNLIDQVRERVSPSSAGLTLF